MSNLDLEIKTFQFKTIESPEQWNTYKVRKPAMGEPVFVATTVFNDNNNQSIDYYMYVGDGMHKLEELKSANKFLRFLPNRKITYGTDDPSGGAIGDIYIKYEG